MRVAQRKMAEVSIIAPKDAKEEHDAELARSARDAGGTGDDALAEVVTSGTGTDADAGEYLNKAE